MRARIDAVKSRQQARRAAAGTAQRAAVASLLHLASPGELRVSLDNTPHPNAHVDENAIIAALRVVGAARGTGGTGGAGGAGGAAVQPITSVLFDGNAWSNVPVAAGTIDWLRVLDAVADCFGDSLRTIELRHLPDEKVCGGAGERPPSPRAPRRGVGGGRPDNRNHIPSAHNAPHAAAATARERTGSFLEARLVLPLLEMLRESVLPNLQTVRFRWAAGVTACPSLQSGRFSLANVLKFNYTIRELSITSCVSTFEMVAAPAAAAAEQPQQRESDGDGMCRAIASALKRSNNTLQRLDLSHNGITAQGVAHLTEAISLGLCGLRELRLNRNPQIGDQGMFLLARCLPKAPHHLHSLALASCDIGDKGAEALAVALKLTEGRKNRWRPRGKPGGLQSVLLADSRRIGQRMREALSRLVGKPGSALEMVDLFLHEVTVGGGGGGGSGTKEHDLAEYGEEEEGNTRFQEQDDGESSQASSLSTVSRPMSADGGRRWRRRRQVLEAEELGEDGGRNTSSRRGTLFGLYKPGSPQALRAAALARKRADGNLRPEEETSKILYSLSKLNY